MRRPGAFWPSPAARAGAAGPRSSARCPSLAAARGMQLLPSLGRPSFCPRLQALLTRLLRPCPAQPTERTAQFTSHSSVLLFSRVFVVSSRSGAKSENLRWSPRAGRAEPRQRGRGAEGLAGWEFLQGSGSSAAKDRAPPSPVQYRCSCKMKKNLNAMN